MSPTFSSFPNSTLSGNASHNGFELSEELSLGYMPPAQVFRCWVHLLTFQIHFQAPFSAPSPAMRPHCCLREGPGSMYPSLPPPAMYPLPPGLPPHPSLHATPQLPHGSGGPRMLSHEPHRLDGYVSPPQQIFDPAQPQAHPIPGLMFPPMAPLVAHLPPSPVLPHPPSLLPLQPAPMPTCTLALNTTPVPEYFKQTFYAESTNIFPASSPSFVNHANFPDVPANSEAMPYPPFSPSQASSGLDVLGFGMQPEINWPGADDGEMGVVVDGCYTHMM